jgi:hypothetical protein
MSEIEEELWTPQEVVHLKTILKRHDPKARDRIIGIALLKTYADLKTEHGLMNMMRNFDILIGSRTTGFAVNVLNAMKEHFETGEPLLNVLLYYFCGCGKPISRREDTECFLCRRMRREYVSQILKSAKERNNEKRRKESQRLGSSRFSTHRKRKDS